MGDKLKRRKIQFGGIGIGGAVPHHQTFWMLRYPVNYSLEDLDEKDKGEFGNNIEYPKSSKIFSFFVRFRICLIAVILIWIAYFIIK